MRDRRRAAAAARNQGLRRILGPRRAPGPPPDPNSKRQRLLAARAEQGPRKRGRPADPGAGERRCAQKEREQQLREERSRQREVKRGEQAAEMARISLAVEAQSVEQRARGTSRLASGRDLGIVCRPLLPREFNRVLSEVAYSGIIRRNLDICTA